MLSADLKNQMINNTIVLCNRHDHTEVGNIIIITKMHAMLTVHNFSFETKVQAITLDPVVCLPLIIVLAANNKSLIM